MQIRQIRHANGIPSRPALLRSAANLKGFAPAAGPLELFLGFLMILWGFWVQEGLENDPEVRAVILTKFQPKRSHLDPVQARFYAFWKLSLRTLVPMSTFIFSNLPSTLFFDPIIPSAYSASPS